MLGKILLVVIIFGLFSWAVKTKVFLKRRRSEKILEGAVSSPASLALGEIVAVAGGIYLALVLVVSFLNMELPERINIASLAVDPLALIAIIVALLQPIILTLYYNMKKN
ncbi:MAG: hypothetical protein WAO24_08590 [Peptococcia bacterium]